MADNVLETVQKLVQDVLSPDVRELKARVEGLERRAGDKFKALEQRLNDRFADVDQKLRAIEQRIEDRSGITDQKIVNLSQKVEFEVGKVLALFSELRTHAELLAVRDVSEVRERLAVLEMRQNLPRPDALAEKAA